MKNQLFSLQTEEERCNKLVAIIRERSSEGFTSDELRAALSQIDLGRQYDIVIYESRNEFDEMFMESSIRTLYTGRAAVMTIQPYNPHKPEEPGVIHLFVDEYLRKLRTEASNEQRAQTEAGL